MSATDDYLAGLEPAPAVAAPADAGAPAVFDPATGTWRVTLSGMAEAAPKSSQTEQPADFKPATAGYLEAIGQPDAAATAQPEPTAPPVQPGLIARAQDIGSAINDGEAAFGKGALSGVADVGSNLINQAMVPAAKLGIDPNSTAPALNPDGSLNLTGAQPGAKPAPVAANDARQAALDAFNAQQTAASPTMFPIGRVAGNIAATAPMIATGGGGALATKLLTPSVGPMLPGAVARLSGVAKYVAPLADNAIGAIASGKAVDPNASALSLGLMGAGVPLLMRGGAAAGGLVAKGAANLFASPDAQAGNFILNAGRQTADDIPWLRSQLTANATDGAGVPMTSAQAVFNGNDPGATAGLSQLQRNLVDDPSIINAGVAQNAARHGVLNALEPNTQTPLAGLAEGFGNRAGPSIRAQRVAARRATSQAFDNVDNFNETAFHLPLAKMEEAFHEHFPLGAIDSQGSGAQSLLKRLHEKGTQTYDFPKAAKAARLTQADSTLVQAVRNAGGIHSGKPSGQAFAGELEALKQAGHRGLVSDRKGQDLDKLAERLHAAGFVPDNDPATLLQTLIDDGNKRGHAADMDAVHRAKFEAAANGDPSELEGSMTIPKALNFKELQQVRSTLAAAARKIEESASGKNNESVALRKMQAALDEHVGEVAGGAGAEGEVFPADNVAQWQKAIGLKQAEVARFGGPVTKQATRAGAEAQDGNLAQKFYGPGGTRGAIMSDFAHIEDPAMRQALRAYAVEGMRGTKTMQGNLTGALGEHIDARSVANQHLFSPEEVARLQALTAGIGHTAAADAAGVARGSPTAQYIKTMGQQGLIPKVSLVGDRVPLIGGWLAKKGEQATEKATARIGQLMANPRALAAALPAAASLAARNAQPLIGNTTLALERAAVPSAAMIAVRR